MGVKKTSKNIEIIEEKPEKLEKSKISNKEKKVIEEAYSNSESDDTPEEKIIIPKPKRVQSEKQKEAFKKAQLKLAEGRALKKLEKDKEQLKYDDYKNSLVAKKTAKKEKKQKQELKELETSSSEEQIVVKKKKSKKIVYISDDDDDEKKKPINIVINNTTPPPVTNKPKGRFSVFL